MTLAVVPFVAACTTGRTDMTRERDLQTVQPPAPDRGLRDVSKAIRYKDGIAYVLDETAMQMVCGALSATEWAGVRDDGAPLLTTWVSVEQERDRLPDMPDRIRRLFTMVLPRLTPADKPAAPFTDAVDNSIEYAATEPVAGVPLHDLPQPMQSQILCTAAIQAMGAAVKPEDISVFGTATCLLLDSGVSVSLDTKGSAVPDASPDRIGSRVAQVLPSGEVLVNVLKSEKTRGTDGDLKLRFKPMSKPIDLRPVAEKVVARVLS
nr:hypothetical protein [Kibdelosporangium sp. MJ126-NF4]CTQ89803.1 hypothetical protein [Kibdelosporangium sp. MJ126-NF4]